MGLFENKTQKEVVELRELNENLLEENKNLKLSVWNTSGETASNDVNLTRKRVLLIPTVSAILDLITNTISTLPIELKHEVDGEMKEVKLKADDKRLYLLNRESNPKTDARTFLKGMVFDYVFEGHAYAHKYYEHQATKIPSEKKKYLKELNRYPAQNVSIQNRIFEEGRCTKAEYKYTVPIKSNTSHDILDITLSDSDLLIITEGSVDSFEGVGVYKKGTEIFAKALAEMELISYMMKNGAMPRIILKTNKALKDNVFNRLKDQTDSLFSGRKNAAKTLILEEGMDVDKLSYSLAEMQMNELSASTNAEIVKLFNVPESMINSKANKYGSIEQNQLHFLKHTIAPILVAFEQAFDRQLLTEKEKEMGYCFRFNIAEFLRTTKGELADTITKLTSNGLITTNEARSDLDLPPTENGNELKHNLADVFQDIHTGEKEVPNMDGGTDKQNNEKEAIVDE